MIKKLIGSNDNGESIPALTWNTMVKTPKLLQQIIKCKSVVKYQV